MAEDKRGNLWVLGGYTEDYQGDRYVSATDPWLAGVNGARAGILVQRTRASRRRRTRSRSRTPRRATSAP